MQQFTRLADRGLIGWDLQPRTRFRQPRLNEGRLSSLLEKHRLDCLVGTTPKSVTYGTEANLFGLAELDVFNAVVLRPGQDLVPVVLVYWELDQLLDAQNPRLEPFTYENFFTYQAAEAQLLPAEAGVASLREMAKPYQSAPAALAAAIGRVAGRGARVGIESLGITEQLLAELRASLPEMELVAADEVIGELLAVKSPEEIECLRYSATIASQSLQAVARTIVPGDTEQMLLERYRGEIVNRGTTPSFAIIKGGPESSLVHMPVSTLALRTGDVVRFDVGCTWSGYHADVGRSFVIGAEPTPRQREIYGALRAGQQAAIEAMGPGVQVRDAFQAAVGAVRGAGIEPYDRHFVGHCIGQRIHELPYLIDSDVVMEAGMVFMVEVPYYEMGHGGFQVEDAVLITDSGRERMTHMPADLAPW